MLDDVAVEIWSLIEKYPACRIFIALNLSKCSMVLHQNAIHPK